MNSYIAWKGGKKLLRKSIIERFPGDGYTRYIEVFGGAGWVLFGKEQGKELEVFNDMDGNLINLYRCIKYHCEALQKELEWFVISREQFWDSKYLLWSSFFVTLVARKYLLLRELISGYATVLA